MTTTALYKALPEADVSPETAERAVEGMVGTTTATGAAHRADIAAGGVV